MAGAGYKLFNTGDVLTAAQVNTYLQEQTVMVFASSTARTTALSGVLAEGMVSYLQDTNAVEVYNGSAWVGVSGAGDVTEVQAGTGISVASGTGPIPVVTNTMATAIDAEGDLIIGDAADAFQRLAIGSNGNVLTVDTTVDGKIKWAAPASGGKVLQVVQGTYATEVSSASSTYADTNLSATITPSSASSKVLAMFAMSGGKDAGNSLNQAQYAIVRTSTVVWATGGGNYTNTALILYSMFNGVYLDSPATTSATTYKIQFKNNQGNFGNVYANGGNATSTLILMEIGA